MDFSNIVIHEASTWLGVPYKKNGRDRTGVDCLNWIQLIFKELCCLDQLIVRDYADGFWNRPGDPITEGILEAARNLVHPYKLSPIPVPRPGCILTVSQYRNTLKPTHVVLVTETPSHSTNIIHASVIKGVERSRVPSSWRQIQAYEVAPCE